MTDKERTHKLDVTEQDQREGVTLLGREYDFWLDEGDDIYDEHYKEICSR